jgi:CP family cyanate transporter-like MFS transporter
MRISITQLTSSSVLLKCVLFIAGALRAPITVVGPLIEVIRSNFELGATEAGLLTTLPLLAFAAISPFAAWLKKYGLERSLLGAMTLIIAGILLRSGGSAICLYLGTCVIGCGIAVGNVLLPSLVKRDFPTQITPLTAIYSVMMGLSAACASVIAVPLARASGLGWPLALTAMLPLLAAVFLWRLDGWAPEPVHHGHAIEHRRIWTSAIAWQVTLFLGLNSFVYYVAIGWLPAILTELGYTSEQAGSLHGLMQIAGTIPAVILIPASSRLHDHGKLAGLASLLSAVGFAGLIVEPKLAALWVVLFGCGTGAGLVLGLSFLGLRTPSSHGAAVLSGMAQSVGYGLAAIGPPLIGALRELAATWTVPLVVCAAVSVAMGGLGLLAGRSRTIEIRAAEPDPANAGMRA